MEKSGKLLILAILAIALTSGVFSWWFRWSATRRVAAFWGPEITTTIRDARRVEAYRLAEEGIETDQTLTAGNREYPVEKRIDASQGHGLVHLKQALLEDRSYEWEASVAQAELIPRWALVFHPPAAQVAAAPVILLFDDACEGAIEPESRRTIDCKPIAPGIKSVLAEWLSAE
ncbi:MAG: hypothetical protein WD851_15860 [Pirellulales bacterium]